MSGTVPSSVGYTDEFLVQIFGNLNAFLQPGQYLIGETVTSGGAFSVTVPLSTGLLPFTNFAATATPITGAPNTSEFSAAVPLT